MNELFISASDTAEEFVKDLFDSAPASSYGDRYSEYCWETNSFSDAQWDGLDWAEAVLMLENDNLFQFVEFNGCVYVFCPDK